MTSIQPDLPNYQQIDTLENVHRAGLPKEMTEANIASIKALNIGRVILLCSEKEANHRSPKTLDLYAKNGIEVIKIGVTDTGLPSKGQVESIIEKINEKVPTLLQDGLGIQRTGMISHILKNKITETELPSEEALVKEGLSKYQAHFVHSWDKEAGKYEEPSGPTQIPVISIDLSQLFHHDHENWPQGLVELGNKIREEKGVNTDDNISALKQLMERKCPEARHNGDKNFEGIDQYLGKEKGYDFIPHNDYGDTKKLSKAATCYLIKAVENDDELLSARIKVTNLVKDAKDIAIPEQNKGFWLKTLYALSYAAVNAMKISDNAKGRFVKQQWENWPEAQTHIDAVTKMLQK